jgi:uncharacterized protein YjiS (DUF1127 family)
MTSVDLYDPRASRQQNPVILAGIKRLWATFRRERSARRTVLALSQLDDRLLRDIGIEPQDVIDAMKGRPAPSILFNPMLKWSGRD